MTVHTVERPPAVRLAETPEPAPEERRRWLLPLVGLFAVAVLYHWLQSLGHVTPAVFTDELMFAELARGTVRHG